MWLFPFLPSNAYSVKSSICPSLSHHALWLGRTCTIYWPKHRVKVTFDMAFSVIVRLRLYNEMWGSHNNGTWCRAINFCAMKTEAATSRKMWLPIYQTMCCHIPKRQNILRFMLVWYTLLYTFFSLPLSWLVCMITLLVLDGYVSSLCSW